jgi:PAS domain S-box-containing protein
MILDAKVLVKLNLELEHRVAERTAKLDAAIKRLHESEQQARLQFSELEAIYDSAPVGLCVLDPQLTYRHINRKMAEMSGLPVEDHIGHTPWEVVPELAYKIEALMTQILETGQPLLNVEFTGETPAHPGVQRTWNAQWLPLKDEGGHVIGINVVTQEITERRRVEEEIKALNEDLKRRAIELEMSNKELEAFTYSVSHDLKSSLIAAGGFCRKLSERYGERLDDRGTRYLQRIQEACHRMNLLIGDLLDLSKLTATEIKFKSVNLSDLVKSIAAQLKEKHPEREVRFLFEDGLAAKGDSRLLRIALENLLGNAWKYTAKRKQAIIEFGLLKTAGDNRPYFVRDNGCGFDMSMAYRLFKPFQRLHGDEEFSGTGIGLATVHRIITKHGGRVWAESKVNKGTTFFFTLPS